jgi:competence protein ComEC
VLCAASSKAQIKIHHINVGQGDTTLLEFKSAAILIDAGGSRTNTVKTHLFAYLDHFFARRVDLNRSFYSVIITHPHTDHTLYLLDIIRKYRVRNLVDNGDTANRGSVDDLLKARQVIARSGAIYNRVNDKDITASGYTTQWFKDLKNTLSQVEVIFLNASSNCENPNNDSLVVIVKYGQTKLFVAGDAQWDTEKETCTPSIQRMLTRFRNSNLMDTDVYKVGHHGAENGTNNEYLRKMTPKISVITAGFYTDNNAKWYGHPRKIIIQELLQFTSNLRTPKKVYAFEQQNGNPVNMGVSKAVYCTCWDGDIVISTDAAGRLLPVQTSN